MHLTSAGLSDTGAFASADGTREGQQPSTDQATKLPLDGVFCLDFIEELIREEVERLAERIFELDYCCLADDQRLQLRHAAVSRLRIAGFWQSQQAIGGQTTRLLLANLPHDCSEQEVRHWVESRGYTVKELRIVRDLVSGASPAFAYVTLLNEDLQLPAQMHLDGKILRNRALMVKNVQSAPALSQS